jgi:pimeloyl-ACP methyl ester carboxylesterase
MTTVLLFLGVGYESVDEKRLRILKSYAAQAITANYGVTVDNVIIVDWERWRDNQPLRVVGGIGLELLKWGSAIPFCGRLLDAVWDISSDVLATRKYITSSDFKAELRAVAAYPDVIVVGHSLGTIPAAVAGLTLENTTELLLISPPIGYKRFHSAFNKLLEVTTLNTTVLLGTKDWLSSLIWKGDRRGTPPAHIQMKVGHVTHELTHYLDAIIDTRYKWILGGYGRLWDKIKKSRGSFT